MTENDNTIHDSQLYPSMSPAGWLTDLFHPKHEGVDRTALTVAYCDMADLTHIVT